MTTAATSAPGSSTIGQAAGRGKSDILGVGFDLVDGAGAIETIDQWRRRGQRQYVTFTNGHVVILARRDQELRCALSGAGLVLPDGISVVLAARLFGYPNGGRVPGPSFMLDLCNWGRSRGYRHFFCGGKERVAEELSRRLTAKCPGLQVVGSCCPPFRALTPQEDADLVEGINSTRPDIVWVGLGAPKQEKWMAAHVGRIEAAAMIGVGAAFDFHSGRVKWAPLWIRRAGMEWMYRAIRDPRRVAPRARETFLFGILAMGQALSSRFGRRGKQRQG